MPENIQILVKPEMIIAAVKAMKKEDRENFLEDLLAATSPDYIDSIKESRADYKSGRVFEHSDIFEK